MQHGIYVKLFCNRFWSISGDDVENEEANWMREKKTGMTKIWKGTDKYREGKFNLNVAKWDTLEWFWLCINPFPSLNVRNIQVLFELCVNDIFSICLIYLSLNFHIQCMRNDIRMTLELKHKPSRWVNIWDNEYSLWSTQMLVKSIEFILHQLI